MPRSPGWWCPPPAAGVLHGPSCRGDSEGPPPAHVSSWASCDSEDTGCHGNCHTRKLSDKIVASRNRTSRGCREGAVSGNEEGTWGAAVKESGQVWGAGFIEVAHGADTGQETQPVAEGPAGHAGASLRFLSALGLLSIRKGHHCVPTGCQELREQVGGKTEGKMGGGLLSLEGASSSRPGLGTKKDGQALVTPGVKEAPEGTFLLSPGPANFAQSAISTPAGQLSAPWGSPSFQV